MVPDPVPPRTPTIADLVPVTEVMSRDLTCAQRDLAATKLVALMVRDRIGCVPVVDAVGRPVGMVTKLDLIERLFAFDAESLDAADASPRFADTAADLMMPLALTLSEHATVAHAAATMAREAVHHVLVVDAAGCLIGVVSTMDIACWLARNDGVVA